LKVFKVKYAKALRDTDSDVGIGFLANSNNRKLPIYGTDEIIKGLCFGKRKCCKNTHSMVQQ